MTKIDQAVLGHQEDELTEPSVPSAELTVHPRSGDEISGEPVSSIPGDRSRLGWFCRRVLSSIHDAAGRFAFGARYRSWRHEEAQGRTLVESGMPEQGVARLLASAELLRTEATENSAFQVALRRVEAYLEHAEERLEAHYSRSIAERPGNPAAYWWRAELKLRAEDIVGALADYDQALEITPNHLAIRLDRGVARYRRGGGDLAGALSDFDTVLESEPKNAMALFNRAFAIALDDPESALASMAAARKLGTWPGKWFPCELRLWILAADGERLQRGVTFLRRMAEHTGPRPDRAWKTLLTDAEGRFSQVSLSGRASA